MRAEADRDRIVESEPADEHPQSVEHRLLMLTEQHVRPVERRLQRLLTVRHVAAAASEQPQPAVRAVPHTAATPSDRARAAASSIANGMPSKCRQTSDDLVSSSGCGSKDPLSARTRSTNNATASLPCPSRSSDRQRTERHHLLAADQQRLPARRHDPQRRSRAQQPLDELCRRAEHVLTVVEHHTRRSATPGTRPAGPRSSGPVPDAPRASPRPGRNRAVVADQCEIDEPHPAVDLDAEVRPASIASRVLPIPPTPTTVTSRCPPQHLDELRQLAVRPTNESNVTGRLPTATVDVRNAGNASSPTCHTRIGEPQTRQLMLTEIRQPARRRGPVPPSRPTPRSAHRDPPP